MAEAFRGGNYLVYRSPVFSVDGKFLLVCTGYTVSVFSTATTQRIAQLCGHTDTVTSIVVMQSESALTWAWTGSLDGTVRLWNYMSGVQIKSVIIGHPIESMVIPAASRPDNGKRPVLAFLSISWKAAEPVNPDSTKAPYFGRVSLFNLTNKKEIPGKLAKMLYPRMLTVSQMGNFVGMADRGKVWVWKDVGVTESCAKMPVTILHHQRSLTAMTFDPTETSVAAGDIIGKIIIWKNIGERTFGTTKGELDKQIKEAEQEEANKETDYVGEHVFARTLPGAKIEEKDDAESCTTYHWHSHEVAFVRYTSDGAYLISGGMESVLVLWQMETGKQQYLPRLKAPLCHITPSLDPAVFVLACADNSLRFLNIGNMRFVQIIEGIKPPVPAPNSYEWLNLTRATLDPLQGKIVLPSVNVVLQFYDVFKDRPASEIQISQRNFITAFEQSKSSFAQSTLVTHVTFSNDCSVMVTVDIRVAERGVGGGSSLKFWTRVPGRSPPYVMNTRVEDAHSAEISSLAYHPLEDLTVTSSHGCDFKIWVLAHSSKGVSWRCRSAGSYRKKRMHATAFSPDGTILAVSAEEFITLWNPKTNGLLSVLSSTGFPEPVGLLSFVIKTNFLIAASYGVCPRLTVWNLSTLSAWWSYSLEIEGMSVDPERPCFAVLASHHPQYTCRRKSKDADNQSYICLFNPETPVPLSVWNFRNGVGGALQFIPNKFVREIDEDASNNSRLVAFTKLREYVFFDPYESQSSDLKPVHCKIDSLQISEGKSAYKAMYGELQLNKKSDEQQREVQQIKSKQPWGDVLSGPSHILPPLTQVGVHVIDSFLNRHAT